MSPIVRFIMLSLKWGENYVILNKLNGVKKLILKNGLRSISQVIEHNLLGQNV
jgi:hypothetical protein